MEIKEKIILGIFIGLVVGVVYLVGTRECLNGHTEKQWQMPSSVVVGQSQNFGGVAVPVGNAREVEVFVCDEYK